MKTIEAMNILSTRIKDFEQKYDMTIEQVKQKLDSGEIAETLEICQWLMDENLLERIKKGK